MELHEPVFDDPHEMTRNVLRSMEEQLVANATPNNDYSDQREVIAEAIKHEDPTEYLQHLRWAKGEDCAAAKVLNSLFT